MKPSLIEVKPFLLFPMFIVHFHRSMLFQKFKVTEWPKEDYGNFYNGDSYIVLNVRLLYTTHILIIVCIFTNYVNKYYKYIYSLDFSMSHGLGKS